MDYQYIKKQNEKRQENIKDHIKTCCDGLKKFKFCIDRQEENNIKDNNIKDNNELKLLVAEEMEYLSDISSEVYAINECYINTYITINTKSNNIIVNIRNMNSANNMNTSNVNNDVNNNVNLLNKLENIKSIYKELFNFILYINCNYVDVD